MNLSDYINIALEEIARGIKKADATYKTMGGRVLTETNSTIEGIPHIADMVQRKACYRPISNIHFKVCVEMQETEDVQGEVRGTLKIVSASKTEHGQQRTTQLQELSFDVPVLLPSDQKQTDKDFPSFEG